MYTKRDTPKKDEGKFQYTGSWKDALPLQDLGYGFTSRTTDLVQPTDEHKTRANSEEKKGT